MSAESELENLGQQFQESHGTPPTHVEVPDFIKKAVDGLNQHPVMASTIGPVETIEYMQTAIVGEVVCSDAETDMPVKQVPLEKYNTVLAKTELEPFGRRLIQMRHGGVFEGDLLASISVDPYGKRCEVLRDIEGPLAFALINSEDKVQRVVRLDSEQGSVRAGLGEIFVTHNAQDTDRWILEYRADPQTQQQAKLTISESVEVIDTRTQRDAELKERKRLKRRRWLTGLVGSAAVVGTLVPGGLIDIVSDPFVTSEDTVRNAIEVLHPDSNSPEAIAEWLKIQTASVAVEHTLADLDENDYQSIINRAEEYKNSHADEFIEREAVNTILEQILSAQTRSEVQQAVSAVGQFYGYDFVLSDAASVDALKYTSTEVVQELTTLPKGLASQAELQTIYLETVEEVNVGAQNDSGRSGYYNFDDKAIHVISVDAATATKDSIFSIPGSFVAFDVGNTFAHEFAHALDFGDIGIGIAQENTGVGEDKKTENTVQDVFWGGILDYPQVVSSYSRSNERESKAEILSGIFTDKSNGLAHPDEVRSFVSPANKLSIANLVTLESFDPGLADYLVAQNDRLMRGQAIDQ